MLKCITGYCPILEEDYSIHVTYDKVSTLTFQGFIKDTFQCEYVLSENACPITDCPIYLAAPETL